MADERMIIGEDKIIELCRDEDGVGWSRTTFYNYLADMKRVGAVFTLHLGRPPRKRLCSYPSYVKAYFMTREQKKHEIRTI